MACFEPSEVPAPPDGQAPELELGDEPQQIGLELPQQREAREAPRTSVSRDALIGAVVLPGLHIFVTSAHYSFVPLHCMSVGISLLSLGVASCISQLARMFLPVVAAQCLRLEQLSVLRFALPAATGFISAAFPQSELALFANIAAMNVTLQKCVNQALAVSVHPHDEAGALRMCEGSFVIGYCGSSLFGGIVYYMGGYRWCMLGQGALLTTGVLLCLLLPQLRPRVCAASGGGASPQVEEQSPQSSVALSTSSSEIGTAEGKLSSGRSVGWWCLVLFYGLCLFCTNLGYGVEWSIYSVYLTEKFGTNLIGLVVAQFAGDIFGSAMLFASLSGWLRRATPTRLCFCGLRVNLVILSILYAGTFVGFASPSEFVTISAQVVMGTLYVLLVQTCTELVSRACQGDRRLYQRCTSILDFFFSAAALCANFAAYAMYEVAGGDLIIYICAGLIGSFALASAIVVVSCGLTAGDVQKQSPSSSV